MRCKARPGILLSTSAWFEQFVVILAYVANGKIIRGKGMLAATPSKLRCTPAYLNGLFYFVGEATM
jgi:hypothetical protein